MFSEN